MSMIEDLKNIEGQQFGLYCLAFLSIFAPGFLIIYLYKPDFILNLNPFVLLVFSASLTLPLVALNLIFGTLTDPHEEAEPLDFFLFSAVTTFIGFYVVILVAYIFSLEFKYFLGGIAILEVILLIISLVDRVTSKKIPNKSSKRDAVTGAPS